MSHLLVTADIGVIMIKYESLTSDRRYRVDKIIDWLSRRIRKSLIQATYYREFHNKFNSRNSLINSFHKDYKIALKMITKAQDSDKESRYAMAVISREEIINTCKDAGDYKTALSAEKDLATLQGLYKDDNGGDINVVFNQGVPMAKDNDELVDEETLEEYRNLANINEE